MDQFQKQPSKGKYNGITEYLAFKTGSKNESYVIFNKQLSVSPPPHTYQSIKLKEK